MSTKQMQEEIIDFFSHEKKQERVSSWVYLFYILRFFFNKRNFVIALVCTALYFSGSFAVQEFKSYRENAKAMEIKEAELDKEAMNLIFSNVLKNQKDLNYLQMLNIAEDDIMALYTENTITVKKYFSGSDLRKKIDNAHGRYKSIMDDISQDKKMFTLIIDSAQMNNTTIHNLKTSTIQKYYQRMELYKTKNYQSLFGSSYTNLFQDVAYLSKI